MKKFIIQILLFATLFGACKTGNGGLPLAAEDEKLLDLVQKQTFNYFWDGAEPVSGLARERFHVDEKLIILQL